VKILWTTHAEERQREWQRRKSITRQLVEEVAGHPEQVVPGDQGTRVAQSLWRDGLLRIPFVDTGEERKLLTVYWTSRVKRYWREPS